MNLRNHITGIFACIGILILILDSETAMSGAAAGINLCLKTVIPSLFPFLFLCSLLSHALWGSQSPWLNKIGRKLGIPSGAESILISAVLGGYPAGAQTIGTAVQNKSLEKEDALHLLTFCNNAGPAFLFGMTVSMFPDHTTVWALWIIQIMSAILTAISCRHIPEKPAKLPVSVHTVSELLTRSVQTMTVICGWVLLFRVLSAFLERWVLYIFPREIQVIVTGLLELSNGCCALSHIGSIPLRFMVCSCFLSFGGVCVTMQTISVIGKLSPVSYLSGKLRQLIFSLILSALFLYLGWTVLFISCVILLIFPVHSKKRCRFQALQGV